MSTLEMWQTMWKRHALSAPPDSPATLESMISAYLLLEREAANLPARSFVTIRYEDRIADPHQTIGGRSTAA